MAEADMWTRKPKRTIHNQFLVQLLLILTFAIPLPAVGLGFWLVFAVYPAVAVPGVIILWASSTTIYSILAIYIKVRQRHS